MATHHNQTLSRGELMNPHMPIDSDPMLPVIRTSLHTTELKPDPTPSTDPELFDKSTGHPNTHYDHSKTLSKKKRAKLYGTSSPQLTQKPSTMKIDRSNVIDGHDAHEKVEHNKARDERQETYDHNIAKSKDATSDREDQDSMSKRDEVSKPADKSDKSSKKSDKSDKSSDKSDDSEDNSENSGKSESILGRAANLASGLLGSVKDKVLGKSEDSSEARQSSKEQSA